MQWHYGVLIILGIIIFQYIVVICTAVARDPTGMLHEELEVYTSRFGQEERQPDWFSSSKLFSCATKQLMSGDMDGKTQADYLEFWINLVTPVVEFDYSPKDPPSSLIIQLDESFPSRLPTTWAAEVRYADGSQIYDVDLSSLSVTDPLIIPAHGAPIMVALFCATGIDTCKNLNLLVTRVRDVVPAAEAEANGMNYDSTPYVTPSTLPRLWHAVASPAMNQADCTELLAGNQPIVVEKMPTNIDKPTTMQFLTGSMAVASAQVTLCVQMDASRLNKLRRLAELWGGPISVAVFIDRPEQQEELAKWWRSSPYLSLHADIHLVRDDGEVPFGNGNGHGHFYPYNTLRNVAIAGARSDWLMYIEGDMILDATIRERLEVHLQRDMLRRAGSDVAYIVPLFKALEASSEVVVGVLPATPGAVPPAVGAVPVVIPDAEPVSVPADVGALRKKADTISAYPMESHGYFKEDQWYARWAKNKQSGQPQRPYPVELNFGMEPYFVVEKRVTVDYDQHMFCQRDKTQHVQMLRNVPFQFFMLPDVFVIDSEAEVQAAALPAGLQRHVDPKEGDFCVYNSVRAEVWLNWNLATLAHVITGRTKYTYDYSLLHSGAVRIAISFAVLVVLFLLLRSHQTTIREQQLIPMPALQKKRRDS